MRANQKTAHAEVPLIVYCHNDLTIPELGTHSCGVSMVSTNRKIRVNKFSKGYVRQPRPSNRTINIETGVLRQIMKKFGEWERIKVKGDVTIKLPEREDAGRGLTAAEESMLILECGRSISRVLLPFVMRSLETGARYNTIRTLQWSNIDFVNRCLKFGKGKTKSGTGRTVPLSQRAIETLKFWAQ